MRDDRNIFSSGVHESLDGTSLVDMLFDQFRDVRFLHPCRTFSGYTTTMGPISHIPWHPVGTTRTSSASPFSVIAFLKASVTSLAPLEVQFRAAADQDMGTDNRACLLLPPLAARPMASLSTTRPFTTCSAMIKDTSSGFTRP